MNVLERMGFNLEVLIPVMFLMIPVVAILTTHQQKMAKIVSERQPQTNSQDNDIAAMRQEMRELRHLVNGLALAVDDMKQTKVQDGTLQDRINNG
jgi:soluble cytochrome b562